MSTFSPRPLQPLQLTVPGRMRIVLVGFDDESWKHIDVSRIQSELESTASRIPITLGTDERQESMHWGVDYHVQKYGDTVNLLEEYETIIARNMVFHGVEEAHFPGSSRHPDKMRSASVSKYFLPTENVLPEVEHLFGGVMDALNPDTPYWKLPKTLFVLLPGKDRLALAVSGSNSMSSSKWWYGFRTSPTDTDGSQVLLSYGHWGLLDLTAGPCVRMAGSQFNADEPISFPVHLFPDHATLQVHPPSTSGGDSSPGTRALPPPATSLASALVYLVPRLFFPAHLPRVALAPNLVMPIFALHTTTPTDAQFISETVPTVVDAVLQALGRQCGRNFARIQWLTGSHDLRSHVHLLQTLQEATTSQMTWQITPSGSFASRPTSHFEGRAALHQLADSADLLVALNQGGRSSSPASGEAGSLPSLYVKERLVASDMIPLWLVCLPPVILPPANPGHSNWSTVPGLGALWRMDCSSDSGSGSGTRGGSSAAPSLTEVSTPLTLALLEVLGMLPDPIWYAIASPLSTPWHAPSLPRLPLLLAENNLIGLTLKLLQQIQEDLHRTAARILQHRPNVGHSRTFLAQNEQMMADYSQLKKRLDNELMQSISALRWEEGFSQAVDLQHAVAVFAGYAQVAWDNEEQRLACCVSVNNTDSSVASTVISVALILLVILCAGVGTWMCRWLAIPSMRGKKGHRGNATMTLKPLRRNGPL
jgi:hypothetical protein